MNPRSLVLAVPAALVSGGAILYLLTRESSEATVHAGAARVEETQQAPAKPAVAKDQPAASADTALASYQRELLDLAFRTGSAIPAMPHIKSRSRAQERVVGTCLELEQPALALGCIEKIDNWRRGVGYADLAFYCAKNGKEGDVSRYLGLAREHADKMAIQAKAEKDGFDGDDEELESYQDWRRDRVRAGIARTYLWLGQDEKAIEFEDGLEPSESGMVEVVRARKLEQKDLDDVIAALDTVATEGNLDRVRNAINVGIECLARFYTEEKTRTLFLERLEACLEKTPVMLQIDYSVSIAATLLEKEDTLTARTFAARAEEVLDRTPLASEDELPVRAHLAGLRFRTGEQVAARKELDAALAKFQATREQIPDLQRADVLVPIAEAYVAMGDKAAALRTYAQAAKDGAENPNAVPRADDLVELCCSMATQGVEPDEDLWLLIHRTNGGLREPW